MTRLPFLISLLAVRGLFGQASPPDPRTRVIGSEDRSFLVRHRETISCVRLVVNSETSSQARTNPCWGNLRHDLRTHRDAGNPDEPKSLRKTCDAQRFSEGRDLLRIGHPQHRIVGRLGERMAAHIRRGTLPADAAWPI
jgi:hypothetical protein